MNFFHSVTACIRQQSGYCCVTYQVCNDYDTDGFSLDSRLQATGGTTIFTALFDTSCTLDYVAIPGYFSDYQTYIQPCLGMCILLGATGSCTTKDVLHNKFCSTALNPAGIITNNVPVCGDYLYIYISNLYFYLFGPSFFLGV